MNKKDGESNKNENTKEPADQQRKQNQRVGRYVIIAVSIAVGVTALYFLSQYNYLLFHSIAEFFSIIIAFGIFIIAWNSRRIIDNYFFLFIGIAFLFIGGLDFIHTISYKGMGVFPGIGTNTATQLWIAARYLQSISFLTAFLFIRRKFRPMAVIGGYTVITGLILASILYWQNFPAAFIEGVGLTSFKILSEYAISLLLFLSIVLLIRNRTEFDQNVMEFLIVSLGLTIASEMSFTLYTDPYGVMNMLGHLLKVVAFYFIYKALVEIGLTQPDELLFRNLKKSEEVLAHQKNALSTLNDRLMEEIAVRQTIEEALRHQEERYRSTLDNMLEGCQIIDFDWRYVYINNSAAKHGANTKESLIGRTMMEAYPEIENTTLFPQLDHCMKSRTSHQMENEFVYPDGSKAWFELSIQPVPEGIFILSQDITERKKVQEKIQELTKNLIQRSAELSAANKELEAFSYSVSHDLRTPLRSIDGFSHALLEDYQGRLDEQGKDYLVRILSAATHMGQLIDDLLRLSRINREELHFETVDLSSLAGDAVARLQQMNRDRKVNVSIQKNLTVLCDKKLMDIMLDNLLGNAWKFTGKTPRPTIKFGKTPDKDREVFFISDNGAGFDQQYVDKLFVPFQRLHSNNEFQGTGIGLAIVSRIVHRHGGSIWAEGHVGKGATFYFTLENHTSES